MKIFLILFCIIAFLSGCATTQEYYTNPNNTGYTQPYWGGLCENCNRMFRFSSAQYQGTTVTPNIEPEGYGLKKGMTEREVFKILGTSNWNIDFLYDYTKNKFRHSRMVEHYSNNLTVEYSNTLGDKIFGFDHWVVSTWTGPAKVEQDPNASQNIVCPYCSRVQDMRMAASRWTYALQQQQAQEQAQSRQAMGQALVGMAIGMQQAQQQQAIAQQNAVNQMVRHNQQNTYQQPTTYQPQIQPQSFVPLKVAPKITTTTGKITQTGQGEYVYQDNTGTTGRLVGVGDGEYGYTETKR